MGTNTWNFYHCNIDENIIKKLADSFHKNGMAKVGYSYINIDVLVSQQSLRGQFCI